MRSNTNEHLSIIVFKRIGWLFLLFCAVALPTLAQTTAFTYQGRLTDTSATANGAYDFQFALYDAPTGGTQQGATQTVTGVNVSNGVFTVQLDFTSAPFATGADRYLEIRVKKPADASYTTLAPRQRITSAPYAITALNSNKLGGVDANQFVTGQVVRTLNGLNGDVTLAAGSNVTITPTGNTLTIATTGAGASGSFIQNQTTPQTGANFNIDGTGKANIFDATTQYNIGGNRVLSVGGIANLFAGFNAGAANPTGGSNSFFGTNAGQADTTGSFNSFVGDSAGLNNTTGGSNSFLGEEAGRVNTTGFFNSFVGATAGPINTTGNGNSFVGVQAGFTNTTGNTNSFVGFNAGRGNTTGSNNTAIGNAAEFGLTNLDHATAIGADAVVSTSNTIVLGRSNGLDNVRIFGLGAAGVDHLCRNANNEISSCSSSLRYKTNIAPFSFGLNLINQLKPISFDWKAGGMKDVGFGAEDVARINPLFVTYNAKGEVEGVKYDRLSVAFVNAFKEQQTQIEQQQKQLQQQQFLIDGLKKIVCTQNPQADVCKEVK
ncbi:MAG: tail fiber domain-containing protein [Acidobacteriota bacterium]|nr:tail fiber domain-containing protein [Acidobacteriota bacterium]